MFSRLSPKNPLRAGLVFGALLGLLNQTPARAQAGANTSVKVNVPASMRSHPFDSDRFLNVPPGFAVDVLARVGGARFMAVAPNGDVLVSVPGAGKVVLIRPQNGADPLVSTFVTGLRNPHDIVFHTIGQATYVYISESHQINRYVYSSGDLTAQSRQVVIAGLPDNSSPELRGAYGHQLKNIALSPDHKLYLSIASTSNASPSDTTSDPVRCAIYQYNADGTGRRLFARGLRNAEGLAFVPGTSELWVTVNNRDNLPYPFHNDFDGDGSDDYGKVMQAYVDNHPPDEFTRVQDGANYGWPFANPNPDTPAGMDLPPFDFDVQNNPGGSSFPLDNFTRVNKAIQAHSAPLGVSFLQNTLVPQAYRSGAVIALRGSWNRSRKTGYKIIFFPWNGPNTQPGAQMDLITGWLDVASQGVWGRPVDVVPDLGGNLLVSDDQSGTIYKLRPTTPNPSPTSAWMAMDLATGADNLNRVMWTTAQGGATLGTLNSANTGVQSRTSYGPYAGWTPKFVAVGSDGKTRALWQHTDGRISLWRVAFDGALEWVRDFGPYAGWTATDLAVDGDGKICVLWTYTDGRVALWRVKDDGTFQNNDTYGAFAGWTAKSLAVGADGKFRVLWTHTDGRVAFWRLDAARNFEQNATFGPTGSWTPQSIAVGNDGKTRVLWRNTDGRVVLWILGLTGQLESNFTYGPFPGWTPRALSVGGDGKTRVLWTNAQGVVSLWTVSSDGSFAWGDVSPLP